MVCATTNATLADDLYAIGSKYGATAADKIRIERYLSDYPVTDNQANAIMSKANEVAKIMDNAGVTGIGQLSKEEKNQIKSLANEAANIVGVTLSFKNENIEIYKNGKLIDSTATPVYSAKNISSNSAKAAKKATNSPTAYVAGRKLAYTGNNINVALVIGGTVAIALATVIIMRKKANA